MIRAKEPDLLHFLYYYVRGHLLKFIECSNEEKMRSKAFLESAALGGVHECSLDNESEVATLGDPDFFHSQFRPTPEQVMLREERAALVSKACNSLEEKQRELIRLVFDEAEHPRVIASKLGMSRSRMKHELRLATQALHARLAKMGVG